MIEDVVVGFENQLESQLSRMNCQIFSTGFNSGDFDGNGTRVMLPGHRQVVRDMPSCLIEQNERMRSWRDRERDFLKMQGHSLAVARGQDESGPFSSGNPKGRPKGSRSVGAVLKDILQQKIAVTENGKTRRIPALEVMLLRPE